ncbi:mitochondrial intermembrane space import and assembly protein 40-B-like [Aphidius gifuensis]|uniref:mitochondrial intermembrane space import and assembly protein 40-B-like n=1 Tax=Aphidius gifuensis TaxID=684658 RepID=UPI001CDC4C0B|nr:mitochondrial intermembrane space import and assembly protein 40-B-like [Aphidius gifuensis]XP_044016302.1 mitochondrial intermembrane space import and assembly protein 40-B-like [Aphidius gifuensis]
MSAEKINKQDEEIFLTKKDEPPSYMIHHHPEPKPSQGPTGEKGEIDWDCPCLGDLPHGPCGPEFREVFSCFHNLTAESQGSECFEKWASMYSCMSKYPTLYAKKNDDDEDKKINDESISNDKTTSNDEQTERK